VYLPDDLTGIGAQTFYKVSARIHTGAGGTAAVALSYRSVPFTTPEGFILRYRVTTATGTPTATWIVGYCGEETTLRIPESFAGAGVTQILSGAFAAVTTLESVTIPACVTSIAADAFDGLSDTLLIRSAMDAPAKQWALDNGFAWEHDHTTDLLAAVEPTCTQNGLTQGQWCAGCGLIYAAQEVIPATGHTEVIHPAVPATHVTTGLTQGVSCSVCGEAIVRQEIIPEADVPVVTLPAALRAIETQAFANCPFVCVVLPQGCERIEARAFENSAQLRFVEIPASAARIADDAFAGCADLIIVTEEGSAAQAYAAEHGVRCVIR